MATMNDLLRVYLESKGFKVSIVFDCADGVWIVSHKDKSIIDRVCNEFGRLGVLKPLKRLSPCYMVPSYSVVVG